jgi:hypothetical protein
MSEPFTGSPAAIAEKRATEFRQLVKAYKGTFATAHGRLVLADLKAKFRFDDCEADSELHSDNIIARRCFAKKPIYHIEKMRNATLREVAKPKRALAGNHHDQSNPPPA